MSSIRSAGIFEVEIAMLIAPARSTDVSKLSYEPTTGRPETTFLAVEPRIVVEEADRPHAALRGCAASHEAPRSPLAPPRK